MNPATSIGVLHNIAIIANSKSQGGNLFGEYQASIPPFTWRSPDRHQLIPCDLPGWESLQRDDVMVVDPSVGKHGGVLGVVGEIWGWRG